ncbi:putative F-box domain, leucine-rich repeat domain superfamily, F-box-like domain superfamily [Helianthus annuus]|nr:putative F-box domain, leucine-rich repeat domain superfamily, F-box-like domain superfamily [Helianthus annuus]
MSGKRMSDRKRVNVEEDRLSSLPDDLIHKILSFVSIKQAVETSVLSPRWKYIWTSMPYLNFSSQDFCTLPKFSEFVKHVLLGRNNQIEVTSVEVAFRGKVRQAFVKTILNYAFSHNVQQLNITCLCGKKIEFPLSRVSFRSLKHLTVTGYDYNSITTTPDWEMPALTTLYIHCLTLYNGNNTDKGTNLFSNCASLKNLTIKKCTMEGGLNGFNICHPGLTSLTLEVGFTRVNVDTPQLKNLTIKQWEGVHLISAPNLSSLHYKYLSYVGHEDDDYDDLSQLSTDLLHLEKANICIKCIFEEKVAAHRIVCLLQQLQSVKFLTLNLEVVELLSLYVELISHHPSPFANLKSVKIYPVDVTRLKVTVPKEVQNYLLDSSPDATLTMDSREAIRAVMNDTSARNLMRELQMLLDQWKEYCETNTAPVKQDKVPMKSRFHERMTYWENLNELFQKGYENTRDITSMLWKIEGLLKKLPRFHRAKLQSRFSGLRAEAETIMDDMMDRVKIQCDKKPRRSNVLFDELATLPPSS